MQRRGEGNVAGVLEEPPKASVPAAGGGRRKEGRPRSDGERGPGSEGPPGRLLRMRRKVSA